MLGPYWPGRYEQVRSRVRVAAWRNNDNTEWGCTMGFDMIWSRKNWNLVISWWLVSNMFYFPFHIWDHPSHWRTHIFQRDRYTTNQSQFHQHKCLHGVEGSPDSPKTGGLPEVMGSLNEALSHVIWRFVGVPNSSSKPKLCLICLAKI